MNGAEWAEVVGGIIVPTGALFAYALRLAGKVEAHEKALGTKGGLVLVGELKETVEAVEERVRTLENEARTFSERHSGHAAALETHSAEDRQNFRELREDLREGLKDVKDSINAMNKTMVEVATMVRRGSTPMPR